MEFPTNEEDILNLGEKLIAGLRAHPDLFPNPPVSPEELEASMDHYLQAKKAVEEARAALKAAQTAMFEAFCELPTDQLPRC
uniref:Uncharacterized protein n=1 Tax=Candidatus Kentrum sp. DK TaxID=2126562 RepID=A0A450TBG1_9GAMM|nr:MAG: hypothetical protein BECKDK2373C_GA0170839_11147 [Candidatus Kentron sp. DK]